MSAKGAVPAASPPPALYKLAAALENATPTNLFASAARPMTSKEEFKVTRTKEQAELEEGEEAGEDISYETALGIKRMIYGSRMFMVDHEWKKASFLRRPIGGTFPYGLLMPKDKSRGLLIAVQAQLIHIILAGEEETSHSALDPAKVAARLKLSSERKQRRSFVEALTKILWRAGQEKKAKVVLLYSAYAGLLYSEEKRLEHFIKTIKVVECVTYERLRKVMEKRLHMFEHRDGGGALMFLYSLILSRTITQLEDDLQGDVLMTADDQCSLSLINLILNGQATPYLFNGNQEYDLNSKPLDVVRRGIQKRAEIGILVVDRPEGKDAKNHKKVLIGSMLKTPIRPIWVLRLRGRYSLFFCCNLNLNRDWRSEAKFHLSFYTGQPEEKEEARLTVDSRIRLRDEKKRDDKVIPVVDECIKDRWPGANVDWNGTPPFY
ncbi:inactive ubiquitin carboxyl-terminal hydrolase MINDY-4B-like [Diadema antillarum]|uniref:inactive ubiquitin carboxyl-terminal hydrolase MINDY-4B-like n=1 Tax=Diadema antillarum TaxID=105358 RepID=UPI003A8A9953